MVNEGGGVAVSTCSQETSRIELVTGQIQNGQEEIVWLWKRGRPHSEQHARHPKNHVVKLSKRTNEIIYLLSNDIYVKKL
jgi:hypothetical protein